MPLITVTDHLVPLSAITATSTFWRLLSGGVISLWVKERMMEGGWRGKSMFVISGQRNECQSVGVSWKCFLQQFLVTALLVGYKQPVQHSLPPTRFPPSLQVDQGTKPAPKYLHNSQIDTWKCQNCTCRCNPWEQAWAAEEQPSSPLHCLLQGKPFLGNFKASAAFREEDVRGLFFSHFHLLFGFSRRP